MIWDYGLMTKQNASIVLVANRWKLSHAWAASKKKNLSWQCQFQLGLGITNLLFFGLILNEKRDMRELLICLLTTHFVNKCFINSVYSVLFFYLYVQFIKCLLNLVQGLIFWCSTFSRLVLRTPRCVNLFWSLNFHFPILNDIRSKIT